MIINTLLHSQSVTGRKRHDTVVISPVDSSATLKFSLSQYSTSILTEILKIDRWQFSGHLFIALDLTLAPVFFSLLRMVLSCFLIVFVT